MRRLEFKSLLLSTDIHRNWDATVNFNHSPTVTKFHENPFPSPVAIPEHIDRPVQHLIVAKAPPPPIKGLHHIRKNSKLTGKKIIQETRGGETLKITFKTGKKLGSENAVVNRVMNLRATHNKNGTPKHCRQ